MGNIVLNTLQSALRHTDYAVTSAPYRVGPLELTTQLTSAGFERRDHKDVYDWNGLERGQQHIVLLQYTLSGVGSLRHEAQGFSVKPGQLMLLCIPHDHRYWLPPNEHWEHIYLTCEGSECRRLTQHLIDRHGPVWNIDPQAPCMRQFINLARLCIEKKLSSAQQASQLLYAVLMELLQYEHIDNEHRDIDKIKQSLAYAQLHLDQDIGIIEMADAASLSRNHFGRVFKTVIGSSPGQWLSEQRISRAAELLSERELSMQEIAENCGFNDVNYFGKVFRRMRGISPGQFRDSGLYG